MLGSTINIKMHVLHVGVCLSTPNNQKKGYGRPKSAEPGSPLLRRALSPDRLHPRSAENKTSISPLANNVVKVTPRVTIAQSSHSETSEESSDSFKEGNDSKNEKKVPSEQKTDYTKISHGISINLGNVGMSNSCGSTQLPRIAEEKDSPTGSKADDYSSKETPSSDKSDKDNVSPVMKLMEPERVAECSDRRDRECKKEIQSSCAKTLESSSNKVEDNTRSDNSSANTQVRSSQTTSQKQSQVSEKGSQVSSQKVLLHSSDKVLEVSSQKSSSLSNEKRSQCLAQKLPSQGSEKASQSLASKLPSQSNDRALQVASQKPSQIGEKSSQAAPQKQSQALEKGSVLHKSSEQKAAIKSFEPSLEGRKLSKKHKVDSSESAGNSSTFEATSSGKDKKNN